MSELNLVENINWARMKKLEFLTRVCVVQNTTTEISHLNFQEKSKKSYCEFISSFFSVFGGYFNLG